MKILSVVLDCDHEQIFIKRCKNCNIISLRIKQGSPIEYFEHSNFNTLQEGTVFLDRKISKILFFIFFSLHFFLYFTVVSLEKNAPSE